MSQAAKQLEQAVGRLKSVADEAGTARTPKPQFAGAFTADALRLDTEAETRRIAGIVREQILKHLRRRGAVVGLSGGIDSSVCAALCVEALGPKNVLAVLMPERDSESDSLRLGRLMAEALGIGHVVENIAPMLIAAGCYERRDECIRRLVPEFGPGWGCKVVIANPLAGEGFSLTMLVVQSPEYDQGFFVKNGDGAADVKPIAHRYKSQVYALAEHLGVPAEIRRRPPTTDTWSLAQSQEEFYFSLPYREMDLCLYGLNNGVPAGAVAQAAGLTAEQVERVWRDIASKRRTTAYLHEPPLLVEPVR
jgi:NAD+ synthase